MSTPDVSAALVPLAGEGSGSFDRILALVLDSVSSEHTRPAYERALSDFLRWFQANAEGGFTKAAVQKYRARCEELGLSSSTINQRLAAIRKLATEAADNGLLAPELASGIARVKGVPQHGVRVGNWLTKEQAEALLATPDTSTLKGKRDRALLSLLLGCGLRRNEVAQLSFDDIQQREGRWVIVDLKGKHGRIRTVPMPGWAKVAIDAWRRAIDDGVGKSGLGEGRVARALNKAGNIASPTLTPRAVFQMVRDYGQQIGVTIAPHDLRRTFGKLAHKGNAALEQIQLSLGHASVVTTERYLGVRQNLHDAPCDYLGLEVEGE